MAKIEKKILPEYFDLVASGKKKYELRTGDFVANEGDELLLREWSPETKTYTGREIKKRINFVARFFLEDLYCLWSKEEIERHGIQILQLD